MASETRKDGGLQVTLDALSGLSLVTLPAGPAANPHAVLGQSLRATLDRLRADYDLVIVDTPRVLALPDALYIGRLANETILLTAWRSTRRSDVLAALRLLRRAQVQVNGVVLTKVELRALSKKSGDGFYQPCTRPITGGLSLGTLPNCDHSVIPKLKCQAGLRNLRADNSELPSPRDDKARRFTGAKLTLSRPLSAPALATPRAIAPDALKATAIFAVVYIHASSLFIPNDAITGLVKIFRFCVPAFVITWAYFQERAYLRRPSWRANVPHRFFLVLLPFVVWTVFYSLLDTSFSPNGVMSYLSHEWAGYGWSGQYFFLILLQLIVLFPLLRLVAISRALLVAILAAYALAFGLLNSVSLPSWLVKLSYRPFIYWLPHVMLGIYLARHRDERLPEIAGVGGLLLIVAEALFAWPHPEFDDQYAKPGMLIGSMLIAACVLNRAEFNSSRPSLLTRMALLMGGSTMGIFVLNPLAVRLGSICAAALEWREPNLSAASSLAFSLGYAVLLLLMCLAATRALKRMGLGQILS